MENQNKIPKIIHCCWLSGDPVPEVYQQCVDSWKRHMPDYEIMLWDKKRSPVDEVRFVKQACEAKKWSYAADYIRLYALYHHGGIYLDMDVLVYKSFDPFLVHSAFSSIEFDPRLFYSSLRKKEVFGVAIEAAVIGAQKGHAWILDIMEFYHDKEFINDPDYYMSIMMPRVMLKVSVEKYGFRYVPVFQLLKDDVHLYPPDVFSSSYDWRLDGISNNTIDNFLLMGEINKVRYAFHLCAHGWWNAKLDRSFGVKIKKIIFSILGANVINTLQKPFKRKPLWK